MTDDSTERLRRWLRGILAGPLALAAAVLVMTGSALWLPPGSAQVNNLVVPAILFPLLWTAFFLYACLDRKLARGYAVVGAFVAGNAGLVVWHLAH